MDVSQFTKDVILQISKGIKSAKDEGDIKAVGTTNHNKVISALSPGLMQDHQHHLYTVVDFDIAVTVSSELSGGGGLKIPVFSATAEGKHLSETVSRVKFSVPVSF